MKDRTLSAGTGYINFSPIGFRLVVRNFFRCETVFKPSKFSIVPFFLYCRTIELCLEYVQPGDAANRL